jgi:bifunctional non-homologous end joining protein LigD
MLEEYLKKRDFTKTPEPRLTTTQKDDNTVAKNEPRFVVHKHNAKNLHYDFRLESKKEKVIKSWALRKGVSLNPKVRRLAVLT